MRVMWIHYQEFYMSHIEFDEWDGERPMTPSIQFLCTTKQTVAYYQRNRAIRIIVNEMKWNESGFRPPLCTYRLSWAMRTSWGWWDEWDDTVLQTQGSKFTPSTLTLGHGDSPQYWVSHVDGEETFLILSNRRDRELNPEFQRERQRC